jgi:hypothetical protein
MSDDEDVDKYYNFERPLSSEKEFEIAYGESSAPFAHPWPRFSLVPTIVKVIKFMIDCEKPHIFGAH